MPAIQVMEGHVTQQQDFTTTASTRKSEAIITAIVNKNHQSS